MLYATNRFRGDGVTTQYEINFVGGYISRAHVKAYGENPATYERWPIAITPEMFLNATTIAGLPPMSTDHYLVIYRDTPRTALVDFVNTSRFSERNLDVAAQQGVLVAAEAMDLVNGDLVKQLVLDAAAVQAGVVTAQNAAALSGTYAGDSAASANLAEAARLAAEAYNETTRWASEWAGASASEAQAAAATALAAYTQANDARAAAQLAAVNAATARDAILTRVGAAGAAALAASSSAGEASVSAATAQTAAAASGLAATDAADYATQAGIIRDALAGGSLGFPAVAYDWGSVADPTTYFNRDFGLIT